MKRLGWRRDINCAAEMRKALPNITCVIINAANLQQVEIFFLKCHPPVMTLLVQLMRMLFLR